MAFFLLYTGANQPGTNPLVVTEIRINNYKSSISFNTNKTKGLEGSVVVDASPEKEVRTTQHHLLLQACLEIPAVESDLSHCNQRR